MSATPPSPALLVKEGGSGEATTSTRVVVHPLVLLHVLDHHNRRNEAGSRVIGTLLGRRRYDENENRRTLVVEVTNAFAVPHAERGEEVAIGKDFNRTMLGLHLRATAAVSGAASASNVGGRNRQPPAAASGPSALSDSFLVGWYASAASASHQDGLIQDTSSLIHEFYAATAATGAAAAAHASAGVDGGTAAVAVGDPSDPRGGVGGGAMLADPIHLVVDTRLLKDEIQVRAYRSSPVVLQGEVLGNLFHELPLSLECTEPEAIVLREMTIASGVSGNDTEDGKTRSGSGESTPKEELQASMERLHELVSAASDYVDKVVSGEVPADPALGREIADALSSVPSVDSAAMHNLFHESLQDLLMVSYLSNIAQAQITIAEKLNAAMG
jgi:translation initiation factor 3 subunit F